MKTPFYSGIITNYRCTAACRHCMFASSPQHRSGFITPEMSEHLALLLKKSGCRSVHIGGGEPFMNFSALCSLIEKLAENGISIDYIETNASWCKSEDFVRTRLKKLRELGVDTVMASVDPFHIEFVPLERPLLLCRILREEGFDYFICKERYLRKLFKLDHDRTYSREELCEILGDDYIADTASDYGLGMNGRALAIAPKLYRKRPIEQLLTRGKCESLEIPQHCHFDLDGNAVPSGCPGLVCKAEDYLNDNFPTDKYPVFSRLASGGVKSLYDYALEKEFVPDREGYVSRCALCYAMRSHLVKTDKSPDLSPIDFYNEVDCCIKK